MKSIHIHSRRRSLCPLLTALALRRVPFDIRGRGQLLCPICCAVSLTGPDKAKTPVLHEPVRKKQTMAKNFFGILKTECIYRHKQESFEEANKMIDDYSYFYNNERIQTKTGLSPLTLRQSC